MTHAIRPPLVALALAATLGTGLLAGCGSGHDTHAMPSRTHTMSDGSVMKDSQMKGMSDMGSPAADPTDGRMQAGPHGPSDAAAMICSDEIAGAVRRSFSLAREPEGSDSWRDRTYRCSYPLPAGSVELSVKDLTAPGPGRAWFDRLRARLPGAKPIDGMQNFGFPGFETPAGEVVFLKDHKTLVVDATGAAASDLPRGFTRTEAAYGVAAAVIACWTE